MNRLLCRNISFSLFALVICMTACSRKVLRPIYSTNSVIEGLAATSYREPYLSNDWLVMLVELNGRDKIQMINLKTRRKIFLPKLNSINGQFIDLAVNSSGKIISFIVERDDTPELFIYRRSIGNLERIGLKPNDIPIRVSINGLGNRLAIEVMRNEVSDIDLIRIKI